MLLRRVDIMPCAGVLLVDLAQVERTYQECNSFRSTARIFGVSHVTVQRWLKKSPNLSPLQGKPAAAGARNGTGGRRGIHLCRAESQADQDLDRAL